MLAGAATEVHVTHRRQIWLYACVSLIVLFLIAPHLLVITLSFSDSRYLAFPPPARSVRLYVAYFSAVEWREATYVSFAAAILTMLLSTLFARLPPMACTLPAIDGRLLPMAPSSCRWSFPPS